MRARPPAPPSRSPSRPSSRPAGIVWPEPMTRTTPGESGGAAACVSVAEEAARLAAATRCGGSGLRELALPAPESERNESVAAPPGPDLDWEQALLATL